MELEDRSEYSSPRSLDDDDDDGRDDALSNLPASIRKPPSSTMTSSHNDEVAVLALHGMFR